MRILFQLFSIFILSGCGNIDHEPDGTTVYEYYYPNGHLKKKKTIFLDSAGQETEYWIFYSPNGNLEKEGPTTSNNKAIGLWKFYYDSGKLSSETMFVDDQRNGPCKYYWENDTVKSTGYFLNGQLNGLWTDYHQNGNIKQEGNMINGKENGTWKVYDFNGELHSTIEYKMGERLNQ